MIFLIPCLLFWWLIPVWLLGCCEMKNSAPVEPRYSIEYEWIKVGEDPKSEWMRFEWISLYPENGDDVEQVIIMN